MKDTPSSIPRQKTVKTNPPRSARQHPWTKEEDALLGKLNDRVVAEKLNRSRSAVRGRRKFLGKTALGQAPQSFHRKKAPRDPQARLFATKSNQELQALLGWSYKRLSPNAGPAATVSTGSALL